MYINGNNTGDINIGNKGADEGYLGANSYSGEGYYNGHSKKDKGFDCIINNNNNNINVNAGGDNVTDGDITDACEECFAIVLNTTEFAKLTAILEDEGIDITIGRTIIEVNSLLELCTILEGLPGAQLVTVVAQILTAAGIFLPTTGEFLELVTCIGIALGITIPPPT